MMMAAAAPCPALCSCSPRPASSLSSPLMVLPSRSPKSHALGSVSLMRLSFDSTWSGLKHFGILARQNHVRREKKGRCRGRVVYASLFGVGAPEALVIGVVALLVFGPKGLAEVARNLGKTLRAFQPTIRELQEVSREFKSSLEQEIGLNEVTSSLSNTSRPPSLVKEMEQTVADPNGKPSKPYSSEDLLKVTEEQLATSVVRPQTEESKPGEESQAAPKTTELTAESPEVTTSVTSPEAAAAQTPLPEEAENERR